MRSLQSPSALRRVLPPLQNSTPRRRSFSQVPSLALWGGTTHPYENLKIPLSPTILATSTGTTIPTPASPSETERIERLHRKHVQDLLNRVAASVSGLSTSHDTRLKSASPRAQSHSLSEPPLFRTDGPLTPYPIELDSGEVLEPKHATLVRVLDRAGEERDIVVAEVEGEGGRSKRVLLAVDLEGYLKGGGSAAAGRKVSAEDVFRTVALEPPGLG